MLQCCGILSETNYLWEATKRFWHFISLRFWQLKASFKNRFSSRIALFCLAQFGRPKAEIWEHLVKAKNTLSSQTIIYAFNLFLLSWCNSQYPEILSISAVQIRAWEIYNFNNHDDLWIRASACSAWFSLTHSKLSARWLLKAWQVSSEIAKAGREKYCWNLSMFVMFYF